MMAHKTRPRMIYPGLWNHRKFYGISSDAFRVWVWMVSQADDEGRAEYYPGLVAQVPFLGCPLDEEAAIKAINEVSERGLADLYEANGRSYYQLHDWDDFQTIRKDRLTPSTCPTSPHFAAECRTSPQNAADGGLKVKVKDNGNVNDSGAADAALAPEKVSGDGALNLARKLQAAVKASTGGKGRLGPLFHDADQIRLLVMESGYTVPDIERMIAYLPSDPFWAGLIVSGRKLREHANALHERSTAEKKPQQSAEQAAKEAWRSEEKERLRRNREKAKEIM